MKTHKYKALLILNNSTYGIPKFYDELKDYLEKTPFEKVLEAWNIIETNNNIMRTAIEIYNETREEILKDGNQSLNNIILLSIEKAQKEMFYYLYRESENSENKDLFAIDFFDKMDNVLKFD